MDSNFVYLVGYQLEKVHTGVIKWLLDFKNIEVTLDQKYEVLRRIYKTCQIKIPFGKEDIKNITCIPEYSFGRKRKIDLVVRIDLINDTVKYLVIEMKVDSIPYETQLQGTYEDFIQDQKCNTDDALFLLFLFGTSQVCLIPDLHEFHLFRLPKILDVFAGHIINKYVYTDWIQALKDEDLRINSIKIDIDATNNIWKDDYWKDKNYRTWFPLFYYFYNELRHHSKRINEWDIYSGQNNPVMNWKNGWLKKKYFGSRVEFYWEFNYEDLVLKIMLEEDNKMSRDNLNDLRREVVRICNDDKTIPSGQQTQNRYGTYNSIYKWKYSFKNNSFANIMQEVDEILDIIHPELERLEFMD